MKACGPSIAASWAGMRVLTAIVQRKGLCQFGQFYRLASKYSTRWGAASVFALVVVITIAASTVQAENESVRIRRSSERTAFSDAKIVDGFFKIAFGAELRLAGGANRVCKFDRPARVFLDNRAHANRRADIAALPVPARQFLSSVGTAYGCPGSGLFA
jgi:hypothetical protein